MMVGRVKGPPAEVVLVVEVVEVEVDVVEVVEEVEEVVEVVPLVGGVVLVVVDVVELLLLVGGKPQLQLSSMVPGPSGHPAYWDPPTPS